MQNVHFGVDGVPDEVPVTEQSTLHPCFVVFVSFLISYRYNKNTEERSLKLNTYYDLWFHIVAGTNVRSESVSQLSESKLVRTVRTRYCSHNLRTTRTVQFGESKEKEKEGEKEEKINPTSVRRDSLHFLDQ
jgi:hypothetical protein